MRAEGQARLKRPRNPGCVSADLCVCATGCGIHRVGGDKRPNGVHECARSCFAACMLLCNLVAALHP